MNCAREPDGLQVEKSNSLCACSSAGLVKYFTLVKFQRNKYLALSGLQVEKSNSLCACSSAG